LKAAEARLMTGDLAAADGLFAKFQRNGGGMSVYQQAQWEFLTGRRKAGMARLEKHSATMEGDFGTIGLCQLSIWKLAMGDAKGAAQLAAQAAARAVSPQARNLSAVAQVIVGRNPANAYALLFALKYQEAIPLLEAMYHATNPSFDGQIRTLLAWAYVETGRVGEARALLRIYPIPLSSGESMFASLIFPRYLYLRGVVLQDEGKRAEAKQSYELYLKYAGDLPDVFGDEAAARRNLGTL
jgi:tetratricopeptide (TPR) repeat protein